MDVNEIPNPSEFQTSFESNSIYEYATTRNPLDIQVFDQVPETNTDEHDYMFVFYGLGGILIFFVVYMCLYTYLLHCKEVAEKQEAELRELYESASQPTYRPPMNHGRILNEEITQTVNPSLTMPIMAERSSCTQRKSTNLSVKTGEKREDAQIDLSTNPCRDLQELPQRKYLFEHNESPNAARELGETSGTVSQNAENRKTLGRDESWMVEPSLRSSTPHASTDMRVYLEELQDLLFKQMQKDESSNERKSDADNITSEEGDEKQIPLTPEGKSQSSPQTPDIVRRQLTKSEDTPRRPFSWQ